MYREIALKPRVLSSMSGIARSLGNAYKHVNSVLYDNCERIICSGSLRRAWGCSGTLGTAQAQLKPSPADAQPRHSLLPGSLQK